jgi:hypothetical protein
LSLVSWLGASAPGRDPFSPDGTGFDMAEPTLAGFAASLPPVLKGPGREVAVQVLTVRETPESGRVAPWPAEPPVEWLSRDEEAFFSVKAKLNEAAWQEKRTWLKTDPAGKVLAKPRWLGAVVGVRADEAEEPGQYMLRLVWSRRGLDGWIEMDGGPEPVFESAAMQTNVTLANRWLRMDGVSRSVADAGGRKESRTAVYLRIEDGRPPAAPTPAFQEPTFVTPAR